MTSSDNLSDSLDINLYSVDLYSKKSADVCSIIYSDLVGLKDISKDRTF